MYQVKLNDSILLTIKRIGINGEGVGFYKKQTIFMFCKEISVCEVTAS